MESLLLLPLFYSSFTALANFYLNAFSSMLSLAAKRFYGLSAFVWRFKRSALSLLAIILAWTGMFCRLPRGTPIRPLLVESAVKRASPAASEFLPNWKYVGRLVELRLTICCLISRQETTAGRIVDGDDF